MKTSRWILLLAALFLAAPVQAQVSDSLEVEIVSPPAAVTLEGPTQLYGGATVTYRATVEAADGGSTVALIVWSLETPAGDPLADDVARITGTTDSTATVEMGTTRANFILRVEAMAVDSFVVGTLQPDGSFQPGDFQLQPGEVAVACGYGFSRNHAWFYFGSEPCAGAWPTSSPQPPGSRLSFYTNLPPGTVVEAWVLKQAIRRTPPPSRVRVSMVEESP